MLVLMIVMTWSVTLAYAQGEDATDAMPDWMVEGNAPELQDMSEYLDLVQPQQKQAEADARAQESADASAADPFYLTPARIALMLLPVVLTFAFLLLRWRYRTDTLVVDTVEFYPPEGLDPAQMGFIYQGLVSRRGIASMAVYYADKGYLNIEYADGTYSLVKVREYDGENPREKAFFNRLFARSDRVSEKEFYRRFSGLRSLLWELSNPFTIFVPLPGVWRMLMACIGLAFVTPLFTRVIAASQYWGRVQMISTAFFAVLSVGLVAFAMWLGFRIGAKQLERRQKWENRDYLRSALLFSCGFVSLNALLLIGYHPWRFVLFTAVYWICFALMAAILLTIRRRTEYGTLLLGKIRGFKQFLESAEKDRLEQLFLDDPEYYQNIVPYTYVLGVSNTWIDQYARTV